MSEYSEHKEVTVYNYPDCAFCIRGFGGKSEKVRAVYDGKTIFGCWAYMCQKHFDMYGTGLGLGKGQKLLFQVKEG